MRVLVVEDDVDTRGIMRLLLELRGHEVIVAANGEEAVTRAVAEHPRVVLMDLDMSVMDGFSATRHVRSALGAAGMLIVAVSAHAPDVGWRARALQCGCDAYFEKPLDFDALERLLSSSN